VGHGRNDGTVGVVTAVVTVVVAAAALGDDIVCAAKELGAGGSSSAGATVRWVSGWVVTSVASTETSGGDAMADCLASSVCLPDDALDCTVGSIEGAGSFGFGSGSAVSVGSTVSSSPSELVWAPPVLTTTPGGACEVVDPVDVDDVAVDVAGSVCVVSFSAESVFSVVVSADDSDEGSDEGVSAHANPGDPVTTAAPIPRATANPPTRPT